MNEIEDFERQGYAIFPHVIGVGTNSNLIQAIESMVADNSISGAMNSYGVRNLIEVAPEVGALANSAAIRGLVEPLLGKSAFPVRSLLFDKTPDANWKVAWHQDLTITVREKRDLTGFGPWSTKEGVLHVQPPASVLEGMVTLRLHLDDCTPLNGPLQVLPGSHREGRLTALAIQAWRERMEPVSCLVDAGGAVLMRPLILHASSPATKPVHRRVIHLEFASKPLPGGLEWAAQPLP